MTSSKNLEIRIAKLEAMLEAKEETISFLRSLILDLQKSSTSPYYITSGGTSMASTPPHQWNYSVGEMKVILDNQVIPSALTTV